jgi:hypothetical protein
MAHLLGDNPKTWGEGKIKRNIDLLPQIFRYFPLFFTFPYFLAP